MTDENISAIRARLKFSSIDEFIQGYARYISSGGIFIPMTANKLKPRGATIRFQFLLGDGSTALLGEGRVHQVHRPDPAQPSAPVGLLVKFTKLSQSSKRIVDQIVELKQNDDSDTPQADEPEAKEPDLPPKNVPPDTSDTANRTMLGVPAPHFSEADESEAEAEAPQRAFEEEDPSSHTPLDPLAIPTGATGLDEPTRAGPDPTSITPAKPILERKGPPLDGSDIPRADDAPTKQPDLLDPSLATDLAEPSEGASSNEGLFDDELDGKEKEEGDDDFFKLAESYASGDQEGDSKEVELPRDTPEDELGEPFDLGLNDPSEPEQEEAPSINLGQSPVTREVPADHTFEEPEEVYERTFESVNPFAVREGTSPATEAAASLAASMSEPGTPIAGQPALSPPPGIDPNSEGSVMIDLSQYEVKDEEEEQQEPAPVDSPAEPEQAQQEEELEAGAPPTSFQGDGPMPPAGPRKLAQTEGGLQILAYDEFSATNPGGLEALSFTDDEGELDSMFDDIFGGGGDLFGGDEESADSAYDDFFAGRTGEEQEPPEDVAPSTDDGEEPSPEAQPEEALDLLPDEVPDLTPPEPEATPASAPTPEEAAPAQDAVAAQEEREPVELVKAPVSNDDDDDLFGGIFTGPPADAPSHVEDTVEPEGEEPSAELSNLLDNLEDAGADEIPDVASLDLQGPSLAEDEDLEPPADDESLAALLDMARKDLEENPQSGEEEDTEGAGSDLLDNLLGGDDLPPPPEAESPFLPLPEPKKPEKKRGLFSKFFGRDD